MVISTNQKGNWQLEFGNFNQDFDIVIFAGGYQLFK